MLKTNPTPDNKPGFPQNPQPVNTPQSKTNLESVPVVQLSPPETPHQRELLDEAKKLLIGQQFGLSYVDVLKSVARHPQILHQFPDKDSLELTRWLVGLHPRLAQEYKTLVSTEGFITCALSLIPFFGRPLASGEFLESNKGINQVVHDLEQGGLVKVSHFIQVNNAPGARMGIFVSMSRILFTLSVTDLGKLALEAQA